jgi:N-methylhydantoinase A
VIRIGVDVGGTFTDVVVLDEEGGHTSWLKVLTNHDHPAAGVVEAVRAAAIPLGEVSQVKVGTTLALNALLTRSGAPTGLITTEGFRDVLEIRRTHRHSLFDLDEQLPEPLVPRDLRLEVGERIAFDGEVVRPLDEGGVRAAWRRLRERGTTGVAIVFLFSFENPAHERRAREIVEAEGGAEVIAISSDVLPAHREYERTSTTVVAAYVAPAVREYLAELRDALERGGMTRGRLSVMTNSGGAMTAAAAGAAPVPTLLSGPAGGVAAMRWLGARAGLGNVLTLDMGGTSTDVSGIVDGLADERLDMEVDGHTISYPSYDIQTIGAGGGSIAWVDGGGLLRVGPASAGSDPGPACYGRGGTRPTVTDAALVLGRYSPEHPLGGTLVPLADRARAAIEEHLAGPLGMSVEQVAGGIIRVVNSHIVNAVRTISVERGRDPRAFTLAAFGGAGPSHAVEVARELSIPTVLVPPFPGCASAFGAAIARTRRDLLRTVARTVPDLDPGRLGELVASLRDGARAALADEGFGPDQVSLETWLSMRYAGQAYDLAIEHPSERVTAGTLAAAAEGFHALHESLYGHSFDDVPVEVVNVRCSAFGYPTEPELRWQWSASPGGESDRPVYFAGLDELVTARVTSRESLAVEEVVEGPAVVHQADSTVLVPPGSAAKVDATGCLLVTVNGQQRPPVSAMPAGASA